MLKLSSLSRRRMCPPARRPAVLVAAIAACLGWGTTAAHAAPKDYVVLYDRGGSQADARAAVRAAGGRVLRMNTAVGLMTARAADRRFAARVSRAEVVDGVARNRVIGRARLTAASSTPPIRTTAVARAIPEDRPPRSTPWRSRSPPSSGTWA